MIKVEGREFRLTTQTTSYWFRVTPYGHLEHIHYGVRLPDDQPMEPLMLKHTAVVGNCVQYAADDPLY